MLATAPALAQAPASQFGLRAGAGISNFVDRPTVGRPVPSLSAGIFGRFWCNSRLAIQPELNYTLKGGAQNYRFIDGDLSTTFLLRLHCLEVPVLARVQMRRLVLEAGPQASVLLSGRGVYTNESATSQPVTETGHLRRLDVNFVAGVGYQPSRTLGLGLRVSGSLLDLEQNPHGGFEMHPYTGQLYATYTLSRH